SFKFPVKSPDSSVPRGHFERGPFSCHTTQLASQHSLPAQGASPVAHSQQEAALAVMFSAPHRVSAVAMAITKLGFLGPSLTNYAHMAAFCNQENELFPTIPNMARNSLHF